MEAHQISIRCRGVVAAVNAPVGVAIFQYISQWLCDGQFQTQN